MTHHNIVTGCTSLSLPDRKESRSYFNKSCTCIHLIVVLFYIVFTWLASSLEWIWLCYVFILYRTYISICKVTLWLLWSRSGSFITVAKEMSNILQDSEFMCLIILCSRHLQIRWSCKVDFRRKIYICIYLLFGLLNFDYGWMNNFKRDKFYDLYVGFRNWKSYFIIVRTTQVSWIITLNYTIISIHWSLLSSHSWLMSHFSYFAK